MQGKNWSSKAPRPDYDHWWFWSCASGNLRQVCRIPRFRKAPFSRQIIVDGRPNSRKAAFSVFSGVVWTLTNSHRGPSGLSERFLFSAPWGDQDRPRVFLLPLIGMLVHRVSLTVCRNSFILQGGERQSKSCLCPKTQHGHSVRSCNALD